MKSKKNTLTMLVEEISAHVNNIKNVNENYSYYNEILGDTSFILAGLCELILKESCKEWYKDENKWIDDSLITKAAMHEDTIHMEGVMIWGKTNTTQQWTDPFSIKISMPEEERNFSVLAFSFGDLDTPTITYREFNENRNFWINNDRKWKCFISNPC